MSAGQRGSWQMDGWPELAAQERHGTEERLTQTAGVHADGAVEAVGERLPADRPPNGVGEARKVGEADGEIDRQMRLALADSGSPSGKSASAARDSSRKSVPFSVPSLRLNGLGLLTLVHSRIAAPPIGMPEPRADEPEFRGRDRAPARTAAPGPAPQAARASRIPTNRKPASGGYR